MKRLSFTLGIVLIVSCSTLAGEAICPVTADVGVGSVVRLQMSGNNFGPTTALRQNQNWSGFENKNLLMAFDTSAIEGWTIEKAYLRVYLAKGELYGAGLCTVLAPWQETEDKNWRVSPGGPSWLYAKTPSPGQEPGPEHWWAWKGSGLYSVCWSHPSARYSHAGPGTLRRIQKEDTRFTEVQIPVDPALVASLATNTAHGLILTDDKGQVAESYSLIGPGKPYRYNEAADIWIFTKDIQEESLRPALVVEGGPADDTPPAAVTDVTIESIDEANTTAILTFSPPGDDGQRGTPLAYEAAWSDSTITDATFAEATPVPRWAMPKPDETAERQRMPVFTLPPGEHVLAIRAVDEAGNRGPVTNVKLTLPTVPNMRFVEPPAASKAPAGQADLPAAAGLMEVFAVDEDTKIDPVTGMVLRDGDVYRREPNIMQHNTVWNAADNTISLQAAANEVVGVQVMVKKLRPQLQSLKVEVSDLTGPDGRTITAKNNIEPFRLWYVNVGGGPTPEVGPGELDDETVRPTAWHPVACVPMDKTFGESVDVPGINKVPSQNFQGLWVDVYVPRGTPEGLYEGTVRISARGADAPVELPLKLKVLPLELPDKNSWHVELNRYFSVGGWAGGKTKEQQIEAERMYYALAHKHRLILNALPYSHSGRTDEAYTPPLAGEGANTHIADWSDFDERWGPLLDGSLFTAKNGYYGPGAGTPLNHVYTSFHEDWPMPLEPNYKWQQDVTNRLEFAEYAKQAGRVEEGFSDAYKAGWSNVAKDYFQHFQQKGWTDTAIQFYYNNKYYWKVAYFGGMSTGGVCFWLLDEPADFDDYDCNAFLLKLAWDGYRKANTPEMTIHGRTDVSQVEMTRGLWDNLCNVYMASRILSYFGPTERVRQLFYPKEEYWKYGGGGSASASPIAQYHLLLGTWALGTDGCMPFWNTFGTKSWTKADNLAIYRAGYNYPGLDGKTTLAPIASTRMKYLRRGQQDLEYLHLLAARPGWSRERIRLALKAYADDPDAAILRFRNMSAAKRQQLRDAVVASLLADEAANQ